VEVGPLFAGLVTGGSGLESLHIGNARLANPLPDCATQLTALKELSVFVTNEYPAVSRFDIRMLGLDKLPSLRKLSLRSFEVRTSRARHASRNSARAQSSR
jgi:hypothetical protein